MGKVDFDIIGIATTIRTLGANSGPSTNHPKALRFFAERIAAAMTPQMSQKTIRLPDVGED